MIRSRLLLHFQTRFSVVVVAVFLSTLFLYQQKGTERATQGLRFSCSVSGFRQHKKQKRLDPVRKKQQQIFISFFFMLSGLHFTI